MAFNPFHAFRKYQRTMFAILAIVCMFTFVLSSGLGGRNDILNVLPEMLGGNNSRNPEVATIDGHKIDGRMIETTRIRRRMANEFMERLFDNVGDQIMAQPQIRIKDFLISQQQQLPRIVQKKVLAARYHSGLVYDMESLQRGMPPQPEKVLKDSIDYLTRETNRLVREKKTDEAEYLVTVQNWLEQDKTRINAPLTALFFGGSIQTGDDIINFMVWKREADRRKIQVTPETLAKLIKDEMLGEDYSKYKDSIVDQMAKSYRNFKVPDLEEALIDEFRVRIVQGQLLGETSGLTAAPSVTTPYEFRKFFNEECKSIRTALLEVDTPPFVAQVTETPADAELKELFERYKKDDANPRNELPGFITPKQVKLEFIGGKPDSPYFRTLGRTRADQTAQSIVAAMQALPQGGGVLTASTWLTAVGTQLDELPEARIEREYERYRATDRFRNWTYSALLFFNSNIHDTSVVRPEIMAATIADVLAARMSGAPIFTPALKMNTMAIQEEMRARIQFGLQPLATLGGRPTTIWSINDGLIPQPLPLSVMRNRISDEQGIAADLARKAYLAEFNKLMEEMKKKAKDLKRPDATAKKPDPKKPDPKDEKKPDVQAEIVKLIDDFVKKHGLTHGASAGLKDRYSLLSDPGLKDLKERYFKDPRTAASDKLGEQAAEIYFADAKTSQFGAEALGLYAPVWFNNKTPETAFDLADPFYLTWKTVETDPKVRTFDEAKPDVIAAWKLKKARVLAEAAAKKLQEKVTANKEIRNLAVLRDFAAENKLPLIELEPLAKKKAHPLGNMGTFYLPGTVPPEKVEYADAAFSSKLLELRDKPVGETTLLHDEPKSKFYVAVLLQVIDVDEFEFQQVFTKTTDGPVDLLLRQFEVKQRDDFRKSVIAELRKSAKVTTVPEELKKFTMRDGGRGGSADSEE